MNRELSWLQFNDRVLDLANEPGIPLLERAKFCAIATTNLDEFFQVRVAALKDQIVAGIERPSPDGRTPAQTLAEIGHRVLEFVDRIDGTYVERLVPELREAGIHDRLVGRGDRRRTHRARRLVRRARLPGAHPARRRSRSPVPVHLGPRALAGGQRGRSRDRRPSVRPAQGAHALPAAGAGRARPVPARRATDRRQARSAVRRDDLEDWAPFRVSRNADLTLEEEEADDLLEAVEMELRRRRFNKAGATRGRPTTSAPRCSSCCVRELESDDGRRHLPSRPARLELPVAAARLDRPDLKDEPWPPVTVGPDRWPRRRPTVRSST